MAAGFNHSLAVKTDGSLTPGEETKRPAWGWNYDRPDEPGSDRGSGVSAVAAGQYHSLYLKTRWKSAGDGMESVWAIGRRDDHGPQQFAWRWKVPEFR